MLRSMTAFATRSGRDGTRPCTREMRGVDGKGRAAGTPCSKAPHAGLTAPGPKPGPVIDQMREQIQNAE